MTTKAIVRDPWVGLFAPGAFDTKVPAGKPVDRSLPELPPPSGKVKLNKADQAMLASIAEKTLPPQDAIKNLVKLAEAGKISEEDAVLRADPTRVAEMFLPTFNDGSTSEAVGYGTAVSDGCASGIAVFDVEEAERRAEAGEKIILVVPAVEPEDVTVIGKVAGIIFATGGYGQHTAVLARDHGVPAVNGSEVFAIDPAEKIADLDGHIVREGDAVSIDGRLGEIYQGTREVKVWAEEPTFKTLMSWAKKHQGIGVYANADSPDSIAKAFERGAAGIGLCRTEHMFYMHFEERMPILQSAILAWNAKTRAPFIEQLSQWQEADFTAMYRVAQGRPVAIRLLDPPRHELLPMLEPSNLTLRVGDLEEILGVSEQKLREAFQHVFDVYENTDVTKLILRIEEEPESLQQLSKHLGISTGEIRNFIRKLEEKNPMLGIRGCRLGVEVPELYDMQIRSIMRAAATAKKEGIDTVPRITIPMLGLGLSHDDPDPKEISAFRSRIDAIKREVQQEMGVELSYQLGAMIETPMAAVESHSIGPLVDYFSYGTNDLTSLMLGADRENQRLIDLYRKNEMLDEDPFRRLHPSVAKMLTVSIFYGRHLGARPNSSLKAGVCGEQGADPESVSRMRQAGMDYVSVSGAGMCGSMLASAQDKIRHDRDLDADLSTILPPAPPRSQVVGRAMTRGGR
jgi:pyruvate,orthophosphate dikinase